MTKEEFLLEIQDILQREDPIRENEELSDYEEWDSLSKMAVMAFFSKKFNKKITLKEIGNFKTVNDLIAFADI